MTSIRANQLRANAQLNDLAASAALRGAQSIMDNFYSDVMVPPSTRGNWARALGNRPNLREGGGDLPRDRPDQPSIGDTLKELVHVLLQIVQVWVRELAGGQLPGGQPGAGGIPSGGADIPTTGGDKPPVNTSKGDEPTPPPPPPPAEGGGNGGEGSGDPLTFDVSGRGIHTTGKRVAFDLDGDGRKDNLAEVDGGVLAIRGGKDGKDLLGNYTDLDGDGKVDGYADGFDALKALALKEGMINEKTGDMKLDARDLATLEKKYGLGMKDGYGGEKKSLASMGITEIDLSNAARKERRLDAEGNRLVTREGADFVVNGQQRSYGDVWSVKA